MKKILKWIFFALLGVLILTDILLIFSGRTYIFSAIKNTYLRGQSGPGIYDLDVFPTEKILAANQPYSFPKKAPTASVPLNLVDSLKKYKTEALLVIQRDTIVYEDYTSSYLEKGVSNSFSVAKSIIGLLVAKAITEGKIASWDDSVGKYHSKLAKSSLGKLTFRQLLTMSSGINWHESGGNPLSDNAAAYYGKNLEKLLLKKQIVEEPGKEFFYQSGNTSIAGLALEKAVEISIPAYANHFWAAIGAEQDAYWSLDKENGIVKAYCCLYSTAKDFAKIGKLILQNGAYNGKQIVDSALIAEMIMPANLTWQGKPNKIYGISLWRDKYKGKEIIYARGILGQFIIIVPEDELIIVRIGHERGARNEKYHPIDLYSYLDIAFHITQK